MESACNKLYRREFFDLQNTGFSEQIFYGEDGHFMVAFLARCTRIYYIRLPLYIYYKYDEAAHKTLTNSFTFDRFDLYKSLYCKVRRAIEGEATPEDLARCKHNFADKAILACILLCRSDVPYTPEEVRQKLQAIVDDPVVIEAMPFYHRKPRNSWTVPLLIRLRQVAYLEYFARKIARRRYGGKGTKGI